MFSIVTAATGALAFIAVLTLLALLLQKELALTFKGTFARILGRVLNVGIIPLLLAFLLIVIVELARVLK